MSVLSKHPQAERLDSTRVRIHNRAGLDITLFANEQVPVDRASLAEVSNIAAIVDTVTALNRARFFGDEEGAIRRAVLTPDFHKGAGIPVGTVLDTHGFVMPRCVGGDVACGMRLLALDVTREEFEAIGPRLDRMLRHIYFEGGRDIPMTERGRAAMLREGIPGLEEPPGALGIWRGLDMESVRRDIARTHHNGSWPTKDLWMFEDYVRGSGGTSRDAAIASIGKGNHFTEIQWVEECIDRRTSYDWGLRKGCLTIMVHTGSVGIGGMVGDHFADLARKTQPAGIEAPPAGFYALPTMGPQAALGEAYLSAMHLAANFAGVNRLMLGALAVQCLSEALGRSVGARLVYDAPHNLIWSRGHDHIHRKGACPAECDHADPEFPDGHPVIVPGSMGDASYLLKGHGSVASLCSAPHGAGRVTARGEGRRADVSEMKHLRVVTKLDLARTRRDVAEEYMTTLMEEAPRNYKPILPAMETVSAAGIASPVAKLMPLLTVKA